MERSFVEVENEIVGHSLEVVSLDIQVVHPLEDHEKHHVLVHYDHVHDYDLVLVHLQQGMIHSLLVRFVLAVLEVEQVVAEREACLDFALVLQVDRLIASLYDEIFVD